MPTKKRVDLDFQIGDPVYLKNHTKKNKLDSNWKPFYRIVEQTSPVTLIAKNQFDGSTTKVDADHLRKANLEPWEIPKEQTGRPSRKAAYAIPPSESESAGDCTDSSDSETELLAKFAKRYRKERDGSDEEDEITKMELFKRLRNRDIRYQDMKKTNETFESPKSSDMDTENANEETDKLSVNEIR